MYDQYQTFGAILSGENLVLLPHFARVVSTTLTAKVANLLEFFLPTLTTQVMRCLGNTIISTEACPLVCGTISV